MKYLSLFTLLLAATLISACEVTVTPDPFVGAPVVNASAEGDQPPSLASDTVTANAPVYYQVNVPDALSDPLLYVEATAEGDSTLTVTVYGNDKTALATSNNKAWFSPPSPSIAGTTAGAASDVLPQAIAVNAVCLGPCVITDNTEATFYVRVSTSSPTPVTFNLYAYDKAYADSTEPANNDCGSLSASAIIVTPDPQGYVGALETLSDVDCFRSDVETTQVTLSTTPNNANINIQARIFDANTNDLLDVLFVSPNSQTASTEVFSSRLVYARVTSQNATAGPSNGSKYTITF